MKKSQLRKVIKESIGELMNEQMGSLGCMEIFATKCAGTYGPAIGTQGHFPCPHVDGAFATQGIDGKMIKHDGTMHPTGDTVWTVDSVSPNNNYPAQWTPNSSLTTDARCDTTTSQCSDVDFTYNSNPCGQTHLVPAPGGANSWTTWLSARANGYSNNGCQHLQQVINWITPQLPNSSGISLARKQAKIDWAGCMQNHCNC